MAFVIAVDGPAASGKGTIAKRLGDYFGFPVLDTGLLYRAVAEAVRAAGGDLADEAGAVAAARALDLETLDEAPLRSAAAGEAASQVAALPGVRACLVDVQRAFAGREPGAVLDGRDIGTVIAPDAAVKLYVTASPRVRAERRQRQLDAAGEAVAYADILAEILARDARDSDRAVSPLRQAEDAVLLDTTNLDIDAAFDAARRIVEAARGGPRSDP
jgi:cytidylate kinase